MKETTSHFLVYSREFFCKGLSEFSQNSLTSQMQTILSFHDSIEFCIRAIIHEFDINHDRNADLLTLIKNINKQVSEKEISNISQIDFINSTRTKVKHHGSIPSYEDIQRCKIYAEDILKKTISDFFNQEFDSISRLFLIYNEIIKNHLKVAEEKLSSGNYLESLVEIKLAFSKAKPSVEKFKKDNYSFDQISLRNKIHNFPEFQTIFDKFLEIVNKIQNEIAELRMGIDPIRLRKFNLNTPHINFYYDFFRVYWKTNQEISKQMVLDALDFVYDIVLYWEKNGLLDSDRNSDHSNNHWEEINYPSKENY